MKKEIDEDQELVKTIESSMTTKHCWAKNVQCNQVHCAAWNKAYSRCKWVELIDHLLQNV